MCDYDDDDEENYPSLDGFIILDEVGEDDDDTTSDTNNHGDERIDEQVEGHDKDETIADSDCYTSTFGGYRQKCEDISRNSIRCQFGPNIRYIKWVHGRIV